MSLILGASLSATVALSNTVASLLGQFGIALPTIISSNYGTGFGAIFGILSTSLSGSVTLNPGAVLSLTSPGDTVQLKDIRFAMLGSRDDSTIITPHASIPLLNGMEIIGKSDLWMFDIPAGVALNASMQFSFDPLSTPSRVPFVFVGSLT